MLSPVRGETGEDWEVHTHLPPAPFWETDVEWVEGGEASAPV